MMEILLMMEMEIEMELVDIVCRVQANPSEVLP